MYWFLALYYDVKTGEPTIRKIEFDGQFFGGKKDCYLYAMDVAYDMRGENEYLCSVELLGC